MSISEEEQRPQRRENTDELNIQTEQEAQETSSSAQAIHVYLVQSTHDQEIPPLQQEFLALHPTPQRRRGGYQVMLVLLLVSVLGLLSGIAWYALPFWFPVATITITPMSQHVSIQTLINLHDVAARSLSSVIMSQAETIKSSGKGHQEAQSAHGGIRFFNAALSAQTIPSGTLLTGSDGVEVVTDEEAYLPAGSLVVNGQAIISAHAVITGPGGNIKAGDIYGPCCRVNIFAVNGAFTGGQEARSYQMITQRDIDQAAKEVESSLEKSIQAAYQVQVKADETLITPVACQSKPTSDKKAGDEGTEVSVTIDDQCQGEAYQTDVLQALMKQLLSQKAGSSYRRLGDVDIRSILKNQMLEIEASGDYVYQFTTAQLDQIIGSIAGRHANQAKQILLSTPGVQSVSVSVSGNVLPLSRNAIHLVIVD